MYFFYLQIYGGLSLQKFKSQRQYWAANNDAKVQAGILAAEPELEEIIKVCYIELKVYKITTCSHNSHQLVIGDKDTWIEQCKASKDWYEYFPGYLYYTEPGCKLFELNGYANNWLSQWIRSKNSDVGQIRLLDKIILNVMEHNMHQV
jgi:nuclear pore complex protein Nup85